MRTTNKLGTYLVEAWPLGQGSAFLKAESFKLARAIIAHRLNALVSLRSKEEIKLMLMKLYVLRR